MSSRTQIPVSASLQRFAISAPQQCDDGSTAIVVAALWEGNYSQGYKSNYQQVETRWLVIEARDPETWKLLYWDRSTPRRRCQQFSGKRFDAALREFDRACRAQGNVPLHEGSAGDAHRYYHRVSGRVA